MHRLWATGQCAKVIGQCANVVGQCAKVIGQCAKRRVYVGLGRRLVC